MFGKGGLSQHTTATTARLPSGPTGDHLRIENPQDPKAPRPAEWTDGKQSGA